MGYHAPDVRVVKSVPAENGRLTLTLTLECGHTVDAISNDSWVKCLSCDPEPDMCDNCKHWTCICDNGECAVWKQQSVWDHYCKKYEAK